MRKLLLIALITAMIVSVTPMMGINMGIGNNGTVYADELITIDEEHFPDVNFRNVLTEQYGSSFDPTDVTTLYLQYKSIESLEGLQYFTALEFLHCSGNKLSSLDVSNNTALVELHCNNNYLSSLDVSNNTALVELTCGINSINSLDISHNTALKTLGCGGNSLSSLDISHNPALEYLSCHGDSISSLDVSNNTALKSLDCIENNLSNLDVSNNTALEYLYCNQNNLSSLDLSNNIALLDLKCSNNNLSSLDLSSNASLSNLECSANNLNSLDLSNNTALINLDCRQNRLGKLYVYNKLPDYSYYDDGIEIIYISKDDQDIPTPIPVDPTPVNPQPAPIVTPPPAAPTEIVDLPNVKISNPSAGKKKITVKWKKVSKKNLKKIGGIQIQIATDPGFTNIVKTAAVGKKKTSKVIKGLQPKIKYYVRIRAYAAGDHVSVWKSKSVRVK